MALERHRVPGASPVSLGHCPAHSAPPTLVQTERAQLEDGRFVYRLLRSPMCEYLVNFLHKLRQLPERYMMNSVLENFTILQVRHWGWAEQGKQWGGECLQWPLAQGPLHGGGGVTQGEPTVEPLFRGPLYPGN